MNSMQKPPTRRTICNIDPGEMNLLQPLPLADYLAAKKKEYEARAALPKARYEEGDELPESFDQMVRRVAGIPRRTLFHILKRATISAKARKRIDRTRFEIDPAELDALACLTAKMQEQATGLVFGMDANRPRTMAEAATILNGGVTPPGIRQTRQGIQLEKAIEIVRTEEGAPEGRSMAEKLLNIGRQRNLLVLKDAKNGRIAEFAREMVRGNPDIDGATLRKSCKSRFGATVKVPMPSAMAFGSISSKGDKKRETAASEIAELMIHYIVSLERGSILSFAKAHLKDDPSLSMSEVRTLCVKRFGSTLETKLPPDAAFAEFIINVRAGK